MTWRDFLGTSDDEEIPLMLEYKLPQIGDYAPIIFTEYLIKKVQGYYLNFTIDSTPEIIILL